tara:strand:- start:356 stop:1249 length:894 start_codon:yes stop_codon:yes gene_type:complete
MKAVMYHYVRDFNIDFPFYNTVTRKNFLKDINKFKKKGLLSNYNELFKPNNKIILTFDDGFKEHLWTAEILNKNKSFGIYFIPTKPLLNNEILDVHKTHLILGKINGKTCLEELKKYLVKKKYKSFYNVHEKNKFKESYKNQLDNENKKEFKKIMNYYGDIKLKHKILSYLMQLFEINIHAKDYYLTAKEIKYMSKLGMIIGSHTESHTLLSRLNYKKQFNEIYKSKIFLEKIIKKKVDTFCYPYGGKLSYNKNTLRVLKKLKFKSAFVVNYRDITKNDIQNNLFELPRYDCSYFKT